LTVGGSCEGVSGIAVILPHYYYAGPARIPAVMRHNRLFVNLMNQQSKNDEPDAPVPAVAVNDNRAANRFELVMDGQVAFLTYDRSHDALVFLHTEVPESLRGRHLGDVLVKAGLDAARREGLRVVAQCPFVSAYLRKHPA